MAIEFSVSSADLMHALKPLFAGRARGKAAALEYVDITAKEDEVEFVSTGMSSIIGAEVVSSGCARVPFPLFEKLIRMSANLAADRLSVQIQEGHIKAGPTTISDPNVSMRVIGARIADLPIDASLLDVLAVSFQFGEQELRDSGLWNKVTTAQDKVAQLIEEAATILAPLNLRDEALRSFVWDQIKNPPQRLRL